MPSVPELRERTARWCLGLRPVGVRKLDAPEIEELRADAKSVLRRLWILVPLGAVIAVTLIGFVLLADEPAGAWYIQLPEIVLMLIGGAILPAAGLLVVRDILRDRKATL